MKIIKNIWVGMICVLLSGCYALEEENKTLSFWTDKEMGVNDFHMLYANDKYLGDLMTAPNDPICSDSILINHNIIQSEDLILTVRNSSGESTEIGMINLFSVAQGIKIKPSEKGEINVFQSYDEVCTLIFLNWK